MEENIIKRKVAVSLGLKRYYTGKPCKYGHISYRETGSGQCVECKNIRTRNWRAKPEDQKFTNIKVAKNLPPQEELLDRWHYDEVSGNLLWKSRDKKHFKNERLYNAWKSRCEGKIAGSCHYANGYIEVRTQDGKLHKAHRIIWKIMTGVEPNLPIDHINGIPWDNRWENLRLATNQDNARNSKAFSKAKFKGVQKRVNDWIVCWTVEDKNFRETGFSSAEQAAEHYDKVAKKLYGDFARLNFK